MGKPVQVVSVDQIKQEIKGKPCDVIAISLLNVEKGTTKKEYIPSFNKVYSAAAVLNVGDLCDATWEKKVSNGRDFFNLVQLTKTGEGSLGTQTARPVSGGGGGKSRSADESLSIMRQNVNNVSMNFVSNLLAQGIYPKKSTPDMLFEEVKRFAKKMEAYVTLKDDYGQIDNTNVEVIDTDDGLLD